MIYGGRLHYHCVLPLVNRKRKYQYISLMSSERQLSSFYLVRSTNIDLFQRCNVEPCNLSPFRRKGGTFVALDILHKSLVPWNTASVSIYAQRFLWPATLPRNGGRCKCPLSFPLSNYAHNPYKWCDLWAVGRRSGLCTHGMPTYFVSWLSGEDACFVPKLPFQICFLVS